MLGAGVCQRGAREHKKGAEREGHVPPLEVGVTTRPRSAPGYHLSARRHFKSPGVGYLFQWDRFLVVGPNPVSRSRKSDP